MINKVTLIGNLGQDPEVRRIENGSVVAKLNLATTESWRDKSGDWQDSTEWHNVVLWRHLAERAEAGFKKGSQVYIEGKLTTRKWQDKNGNDRYTTEIVAKVARLLGRRMDDENESTLHPINEPEPNKEPATVGADDDLPF